MHPYYLRFAELAVGGSGSVVEVVDHAVPLLSQRVKPLPEGLITS